MKANYLIVIFMIIAVVASTRCADDSGRPNPIDEQVPYNENAMLMDLYLSDQLHPSGLYHDNIVKDLDNFRSMVGQEYYHILEQIFYFPYQHNVLLIGFDDTTRAMVDAGEYHAWDSLNAEYKLEHMITYQTFYALYFECCLHMHYLQPIYEILPGVTYVTKSITSERHSILFPRAYGDTLSYFFKYGDCNMDMCKYFEYMYFVSCNRKAEFIGYWRSDSGIPQPEWWDEAYKNWQEYSDKFWR
jgi:hypothetical protein